MCVVYEIKECKWDWLRCRGGMRSLFREWHCQVWGETHGMIPIL